MLKYFAFQSFQKAHTQLKLLNVLINSIVHRKKTGVPENHFYIRQFFFNSIQKFYFNFAKFGEKNIYKFFKLNILKSLTLVLKVFYDS